VKILAIETSCDETAAAVVDDGTRILSNVISSQVDIHSKYGGIVPEVASRQHLITIVPVIAEALERAKVTLKEIDAVAVTYGPGLAGSLLIGVNAAKSVAFSNNLPLIGINHLEGHIYANWLYGATPTFPCLCLIISGGHTDLILMNDHGKFKKLGQTRDDAAGEAFDKGARIIGLGYPGGPLIEKAAKEGSPLLPLPRAWLKGTNDFSFSGLKTAMLHASQAEDFFSKYTVADSAASFQNAIVDVVVRKTIKAAEKLNVNNILMAGGVAANKALSGTLVKNSPIPVLVPPPILCTDNAAMVGSCGYFHCISGKTSNIDLDVIPNLAFA
jgi:N6-L-threonylcarbamoyladenine synthase